MQIHLLKQHNPFRFVLNHQSILFTLSQTSNVTLKEGYAETSLHKLQSKLDIRVCSVPINFDAAVSPAQMLYVKNSDCEHEGEDYLPAR